MYEIQVDRGDWYRAARALESEANEPLRKAMDNLRAAAGPAVGLVRAAVMAGGGGLPHAGEPLRGAIAAGIHLSVDLGAGSGRVSVIAPKYVAPRGFANAPKRYNQRRGWRHRVYGRDVWVVQVGAPGWFDDTLRVDREKYRVAVRRALEDTAQEIARKA